MKGERGFTFIELIIVVAIIALVSGGGVATFLNLRDRRAILADARLVENTLRTAQSKALGGEKPSDCDGVSLTGWQVRFGGSTVYLSAVCPGGTPTELEFPMASSTLQASVTPVVFGVVKGGATISTIDVCQIGGSIHYRLNVNRAGAINAPTLISSPC